MGFHHFPFLCDFFEVLCQANWRLWVCHHPLLSHSAAQRPLIGNMHRMLEPLLAHHRVHLYLNGHMHLLEVYRSLTRGVGYTGVTPRLANNRWS